MENKYKKLLSDLIAIIEKEDASDLHISEGRFPTIRVDGTLVPISVGQPFNKNDLEEMLHIFLPPELRERFMQEKEADFSWEMNNRRFRGNVFFQQSSISVVLRAIQKRVQTLEELRLPSALEVFSRKKQGFFLVVGPTGHGKSTTLASILELINEDRNVHILTIEDPIEFVHESKKCLINQREVHRDTQGFDEALRSALREDPDTILVGEMRDLETIRLALSAAETGHLVFGTLHTTSAPKTIDRIVDVFPAAEKDMVRSMISSSLEAIIAQTLMKKTGGGRVAAHEIMLGTDAIRNMIKENKLAQMRSTLQTSAGEGMQTMDQSLQKLMAQGLVSREVALKKAANPAAL